MPGRRAAVWILSCVAIGLVAGGSWVAAQAPHPTVQFAATLIKDGQFEEAVATLRPRIDANPDDCQALGLMFVAYLQQHDEPRMRPWRERLRGLPACAAVSAAAAKLESSMRQRAELATALAVPIVQADVKRVDETIAEAEKTLGPMPLLRAYVDALKGQFPLLDGAEKEQSLPAAFRTALKKRREDFDEADANGLGVHWSGKTFGSLEGAPPFQVAALRSEGYRIGHPMVTTARGAQTMSGTQRWLAFYAAQIRKAYAIAPLLEGALGDLMTLAFLSGNPDEIQSVVAMMTRSSQKVMWVGTFDGPSGKDWWELDVLMTVDLAGRTVHQRPLWGHGKLAKIPADINRTWTLPFADIRELSQPDIKFGRLKETGYRAMGPAQQGAMLNGRYRIPMPSHMFQVGLAYSEIPVRQAVREYALQIARMIGLPDDKIKLVAPQPGKGLFTFLQIWQAASGVVSESTGKQIMPTQWVDYAAYLGQQEAVSQQAAAQGLDVWQRAKSDALLSETLSPVDFAGEIDLLMQMSK